MSQASEPATQHPSREGQPAPEAAPRDLAWVAEVDVSPQWFALQDSSLAPPTPTEPRLVALTDDYVLIGRESESRDVHPLIDAGDDAGCSRRHADLTLGADGWTVRDLTSVNGTHVLRAGDAFPPQEVSGAMPVAPGDQIFVGAWTRIVLRPAG